MAFRFLNELYQILLILLPFATEFNYDNPNEWTRQFPTCGGFQQSPISLNVHKSIHLKAYPLFFGHYNNYLPEPFTIRNNGHTVEFKVPGGDVNSKPFITSGPLKDIYVAEGVHYHWGSPTTKGTEHKINGRHYDLEMHIVHWNSKYGSMESAKGQPDGLVVVAVLFKAIKDDIYFPGMQEIFDSLPKVQRFNSSTTTRSRLSMASLMGNADCNDYFTYSGSLTTPPCSETVTWIVLSSIVPISINQLSKFYGLLDERNRKLRNNIRPLQPLNNRPVYYHQTEVNYLYLPANWY